MLALAVASDSGFPGSRLRASSLAIAALTVAAGFLASRLLGLLRSVLIANSFGTSPELDAYWVAFRLPDLVFQLLAGATLASAFIPTFAGVQAREGEAAAWRLASSVLNLVLLATIAFAIVAFILAPQIVPLLAPGLGEQTGQEEELQSLAIELTRIMLISPVLFAASGMFMGILNARRHFLTPALAPIFYNLSIIGAALVSQDVRVLAAGVVVGAALHLAVQLPDLRLAGMAYHLVAKWSDAAVREVVRLMAPRILGLAAAQVSVYFSAIFFASRLEPGAISAVSFAWLIVMTPIGIIGMAISTAAFPTLAEQAVRENDAFRATLSRTLRLILYLSLPAGVGLALLSKPLVVVLLQRGEFGVESSRLTAEALLFYAPALVAHCGIEIVSRGFYALSDTRTPVAIAVFAMVLNLGLAALLVGPYEVRGLAMAISLAAIYEFIFLFFMLTRRVPGLLDSRLILSTGRFVGATTLMATAVIGVLFALDTLAGLDFERGWDALLTTAIGISVGAVVYALASLVLGIEEMGMVIDRLPGLRRFLPTSRAASSDTPA
jgi:putative peptidoglycan lipid II flippase